MRVLWSAAAVDDLVHLRTHIAQDNPDAAADTAARILDAVDRLARFPELGRAGRVPDTRELLVAGTPFIIVYTVRRESLAVVSVLHAARNWPDSGGN